MKKITIGLMTILLFNFGLNAQVVQEEEKSNELVTDYDRNAITAIVLENKSGYMLDIRNASSGIIVPDKFDNNLLDTRLLSTASNSASIKQALIQNKVPNNILAKWFARNESGEFNMDVVHDRGMYNATDDEVRQASGSKVGIARLKDAGETLINHSYILVLEFTNIQTMEQIYLKRDALAKDIGDLMGQKNEGVKRRKNGWMGDVKAYLFKLDFDEATVGMFYNDLWIYEDDSAEVKAAKKARFDETNFPVKFVMEAKASADGSQFNPGELLAPPRQKSRDELFQQMVNTGLEACAFDFERNLPDFQVKTPLYKTSPLQAKIGKKEGLKVDHRYFVMEFEQNNKGETEGVRKGVIRAKKIADNRKVATGDTKLYSKFYQVAGRGLMEGMLLKQKNDFGIGVSAGTTVSGEMGGVFVKGEANVALLTSRVFPIPISQLKVFASAHFDNNEYDISGSNEYSFTRWEIGLSKGFYFARNFSVAPFISYGGETGTNSNNSDEVYSTYLIDLGATASVNLTYWAQLMVGVNMYTLVGNAMDEDGNDLGNLYTDYFDGREGMSIDVGLRIEF
jgi:hypothetical protein